MIRSSYEVESSPVAPSESASGLTETGGRHRLNWNSVSVCQKL